MAAVATRPTERVMQARGMLDATLVYVVLAVGVVLTGAPFLYMITGSFKADAEIFAYPLTWLPQAATLVNYTRLLSGETLPFLQQMGNSVFVSVTQTVLSLWVATMVGWGFAKYEFRGKRPLFVFLLATLTFPFQMTLVPLFLLMIKIGWIDQYLAIVIPGAVTAFGSFFMRQNMLSVPDELLDAARIDGSSELGIYARIGLPLSRGAFSILAVLTFLGTWNDYLWPLIVLRSTDKFTYPLGLATLIGLYKIEYGMILAGAFIATIPIVAIFVAGRKALLTNITLGAVKG